MGDSLTAGSGSYPSMIRRARPDIRVINAALPASGVIQADIVAAKRMRRFRPSWLVYQVNVGNDLMNVRYPINWRDGSPVRNLYWTAAHRLRSLEYLNYKLGQAARSLRPPGQAGIADAGPPDDSVCRYDPGGFEPSSYTPRERRYVQAEPRLFENQALVTEARRRDYLRFLDGLDGLLAWCRPPECAAYVLVIPHPSQVDATYLEQMRALGATFESPEAMLADVYPFLSGIREFLDENGRGDVRLLNPIHALRASERSGAHPFFKYDPHLNRCGQRAIADFLLETLPFDAAP
jgi:hypothetical protein